MTPKFFALSGAVLFTALVTLGLPARAVDSVPLHPVGLFGVTGSGKLQTESRAVGSFQAIALHGSMNLVLRQAAREALELRADDNLLPLIETRVVNRNGVPTLDIGTKDRSSYSSRNPVTVTVDVVTLTALAVSGSGEVSGEGLKAPALKVSLSGSSDLKLGKVSFDEASVKISGSGKADLSGKAARLTLSISGSGDATTRELDVDDVIVSIAGSGSASVNARKTLGVSIAGSGSVDYGGDPSIKTSVAGSGSVKKR